VPDRGTPTYPFSAIVGQEELKLALLLNAIDSRVGGVLVRGEKGTAKSTAVRALTAVMPQLVVVDGCRFSCDPADPPSWCDECRARRTQGPLQRAQVRAALVELPVSATEDRLVGSLDLEHALKKGERRFEPGIFARANRSILYVDEVNLLDDHLVDTLLDAAAMGVNTVEREGVSFRHPARFVLIGTMNPEEGELRPQLLDRFGLSVDIAGVRDPQLRVEIVRRRRAFDADPVGFVRQWEDEEIDVRSRIRAAQVILPRVEVSDELLLTIANLALTVGVDGHRADQAMARAAAAHAALDCRDVASQHDLAVVAPLVLAHRTKRTLFDEPQLDASGLAALVISSLAADTTLDDPREFASGAAPGEGQEAIWDVPTGEVTSVESSANTDIGLQLAVDRVRRTISGRTQSTISADTRGRYIRAEPASRGLTLSDIALDASVRAAAPHQAARTSESELAIAIDPADLRQKVRVRKAGASIVFCVDASGSMGAHDRTEAAKAAVLDLLAEAYRRRDRVAVVAFRGNSAHVVLSPTGSVQIASLRLRELQTGGATPLAAGITRSLEVLEDERKRNPDLIPWLVLITDGHGNVGLGDGLGSEDATVAAHRVPLGKVSAIVVDAGPATSSAARDLAVAAEAQYVRLESLSGRALSTVVRREISSG
jgi:magnesium chelatase subunit D